MTASYPTVTDWAEFKNSPVGGLLGVPVGKTSPSKIPHDLRQKKKKPPQNTKQKQKCNKVNKDFRIDSHQRNFFIKKNNSTVSRGKYKIWALYFSKITSAEDHTFQAVAEKKEMIPRRGNWSDLCLWRKFHWNFFFFATRWNRLSLLLQTLCEKARSLYSRLSRTRKAF